MKAVIRSVCRGALPRVPARFNSVVVQKVASEWAALEAQKSAFSKVLANVPSDAKVLDELRAKTTSQRSELTKAKDFKALFWKQDFASLEALVKFYEELMYPVHAMRDEIYLLWVDQCGVNSKIVQTKNATADTMSSWKGEYNKLGDAIKEIHTKKQDYVAKALDTAIYNYVLNALRLAGDAPGAHQVAIRVFHDMTDNEIEFDASTKLLVKAICFGDGPHDSSDLLFSFIEYPERGAHTFAPKESLDSISNRMLDTVAERHTLTFDHSHELQKDPVFLLTPKKHANEQAAVEA